MTPPKKKASKKKAPTKKTAKKSPKKRVSKRKAAKKTAKKTASKKKASKSSSSRNKTQPGEASVEEFLAGVEPAKRREDALRLLELMREVTKLEPRMWGPSIIGFGVYRYRYESGREGEWFLAGFSPRKASLVLYLMGNFPEREELLAKLGRHKTGRACVYVNKLEDIDSKILKQLVRKSAAATEKASVKD